MADVETQELDSEILKFIQKHSGKPSSSDEDFQDLAFKIFEYQYKRNGNYRRYCYMENKGPDRVSRWQDIPAIPTLAFKELVLTTFPIEESVKTFKTSGTTQSIKGVHFFDTLKLYEEAILPSFAANVLAKDQPADFSYFFLAYSPEEAPESSFSHMCGVLNRELAGGKGRYYVRAGKLYSEDLILDLQSACKRRQKVLLFAAAFSLKAFLDVLQTGKIRMRLPKGSRIVETGGFKGVQKTISRALLYAACSRLLDVGKDFCVGEYGMTELSSQSYDTRLVDHIRRVKRKPVMAAPPWMRTLVVDPKSGLESRRGQAGLLRHFDLANRGSVLAVQTEDMGRRVGDGFELLGRARGVELRGCSLAYEDFVRVTDPRA